MSALKRDFFDRRSGKDRRRNISLHRFFYKGPERRIMQVRRSQEERRYGWALQTLNNRTITLNPHISPWF